MTKISLTLGPLLFHWSAERWSDFYARIADEAPVDRVCIGEVVCSKRIPFHLDRLPGVVERLQRAGKEVVLSSLALVTLKRERKFCAELGADGEFLAEINDLSMLSYLEQGRRFTVGPLINVYNGRTMEFLAKRGARSICLPPELPLPAVERLAQEGRRLELATEVWAFGRLPLAISGRCYHARVHGHAKDSCQFVCERDEDGLLVETLDGQQFLAINGVQTLSSTYCSLLPDVDILKRAGVTSLRLSPHSCDMVAVIEVFRHAFDGVLAPVDAQHKLAELVPEAHFSNGFLNGPAGATFALQAGRN